MGWDRRRSDLRAIKGPIQTKRKGNPVKENMSARNEVAFRCQVQVPSNVSPFRRGRERRKVEAGDRRAEAGRKEVSEGIGG